MSNGVRNQNELLYDAISLYISFAEDAYILRQPHIITGAHTHVKKGACETDIEYYNELTDYIVSKI